MTSKVYWQVSLGAVNVINGTFNSTLITPSVIDAVLDSGSSFSYVPTLDYKRLVAAIVGNSTSVTCTKDVARGLTYCTCSSINDPRLLNISMKLGGRFIFYLNNSDYLTWDAAKK